MSHARRVAAALVLAAALACAGCGVPAPGTTRSVEPSAVPYALLSPAPDVAAAGTPSLTATSGPRLYLVDEDADLLAASPVDVASGTGMAGARPQDAARELLALLAQGPTEAQRAAGLASALGPEVSLELVGLEEGTATVELTLPTRDPAADRLPLAVGQVVLTVTSVPGIESVQLVQDDEVVEVALPGGARTSEPVSAAEYAGLTTDP